jgi:hypothetical protein
MKMAIIIKHQPAEGLVSPEAGKPRDNKKPQQ